MSSSWPPCTEDNIKLLHYPQSPVGTHSSQLPSLVSCTAVFIPRPGPPSQNSLRPDPQAAGSSILCRSQLRCHHIRGTLATFVREHFTTPPHDTHNYTPLHNCARDPDSPCLSLCLLVACVLCLDQSLVLTKGSVNTCGMRNGCLIGHIHPQPVESGTGEKLCDIGTSAQLF